MQFIGGVAQQEYVEKTRGFDPAQCLAVGVDVGKYEALCLIADHRGEVVGEALSFPLTESGVTALEHLVASAACARGAVSVRIGVETAGHYHRTVVSRLMAGGHDVVELNPAHVKAARAQQGARRLKTDLRDAAAIVDLVSRGAGRSPQQRADALVEQLVHARLRQRRVHARNALTNQLLGTLDLVFPGLDGCFEDILSTRVGPVLLHELADPDRLHRLGVEGLQGFTARRGVRLSRRKAEQVHAAAADALRLPSHERACRAAVLAADLHLLDTLNAQIAQTERALQTVLPDTPAAVLTTLPGVGVIRASNYSAALGDHTRFLNAEQAYRSSGLVPSSYESAGHARPGQSISREGNAELRAAIIELGRGLAQRDPNFARYRASVGARMKPLQAAIATGHRAHRLAFALMRSGEPYNPDRLAESVANGGERRTRKAGGPVKDQPQSGLPARRDPPTDLTVSRPSTTRKTPLRT